MDTVKENVTASQAFFLRCIINIFFLRSFGTYEMASMQQLLTSWIYPHPPIDGHNRHTTAGIYREIQQHCIPDVAPRPLEIDVDITHFFTLLASASVHPPHIYLPLVAICISNSNTSLEDEVTQLDRLPNLVLAMMFDNIGTVFYVCTQAIYSVPVKLQHVLMVGTVINIEIIGS